MTSRGGTGDSTSNTDNTLAARLRGFGPLGILAILAITFGDYLFNPLSAILVLVWAWLSRTPWPDLGFVRPGNWLATLGFAFVFGALLKLIMKALVMPLLGAPEINQAFHFLVGNTAALPEILYRISIGAGFGEETFYRSYLFERFSRLFGESVWAKTSIVLLTSTWFGLVHYPFQGLAGAQQALLVGLIFGTIFAIKRQIFFVIIAHLAFDLVAVAIIYYDLETEVAHFFFK